MNGNERGSETVSLGQAARRTGLAQSAAQMAAISGGETDSVNLGVYRRGAVALVFAGVVVLRRGSL